MAAPPPSLRDRAFGQVPRDLSATNATFTRTAMGASSIGRVVSATVVTETQTYPVNTILNDLVGICGSISGDTTNPGIVDLYVSINCSRYKIKSCVGESLTFVYPFDIKSMTLISSGCPKHFLAAAPYYYNDTDWVIVPGTQSPATPTDYPSVTAHSAVTYTLDVPHPAGVAIKLNVNGIVTEDWDCEEFMHMQIVVNL